MENTARQEMKSSDKNNGSDATGVERRPFSERWSERQDAKREQAYLRSVNRAYEALQGGVFDLVSREEVEVLARENGYTLGPGDAKIPPLEFVLCCALSSVAEQQRGSPRSGEFWRRPAVSRSLAARRSSVSVRLRPR